MNTWIFSENNQTFGPFEGAKANDFVINNPFAYAWKPSFTHWMPVTSIDDFSNVIKAPPAPSIIPQELLEAFYEKEKSLVEQMSVLDKRMALTNHSLIEFNKEITQYKRLTKSCNLEMQDVLDNIESQYARLKQNLRNFSNGALSDKEQAVKTIAKFNDSVASTQGIADEPALVETSPSLQQDTPASSEPTVAESKDDVNKTSTEPQVPQAITIASQSEPSAKAQGSVEQAPLSLIEQNVDYSSSANEFSSFKPIASKFEKVEYSEEVSAQDIHLSSRMRQVQVDSGTTTVSYDKTPIKPDYTGSFDYLLKGKYTDDGVAGARVVEELMPQVESEAEVAEELVKKRRRRRRR